MVDRVYQRNTSDSAPQPPTDPSIGYPTGGNPAQGVPATIPGPYWYHMITESLRKVITDAGLEPNHTDLNQLAEALGNLAPAQNIAVFDTPGVTNWPVPEVLKQGHRKAYVITGAGGGGGGGGVENSVTNRGAGGGAGGTGIGLFDLTGVTSLPITVGAGGSGGSGQNSGSDGSSSSFGTYMSATGGKGGTGATGANSPAGAGGGKATGAIASFTGGNGSDAPVQNGQGSGGSGDGGTSYFGGGSRSASGVPINVAAVGGGGGGAVSSGGDGGDGIVIVRW
jgi:hypothetical protein